MNRAKQSPAAADADASEAQECAAALRAFRDKLSARVAAAQDSAGYAAALAALRDFDAQARRVLRAVAPRRASVRRSRGNASRSPASPSLCRN